METSSRIRIFSKKWEIANLVIGLLPVTFLFWDTGWLRENWQLKFVSNLIFLNVVHNAFSFYLMWRSDEIRTAIRHAFNDRPWILHLRAAAVFALTFVCFYIHFERLAGTRYYYAVMMMVFFFFPAHHAISQQFGLSRLYDQALRKTVSLTSAESARLALLAKWERIFHFVAIFGIAVRSYAWAARSKNFLISTEVNWGRAIMAIGTVGLVATYFMRPHWRKSNQWVFNLRRLWDLFPMFYNPMFIAFNRLTHAFEYLAVTRAIDGKAKPRRSKLHNTMIFTGLSGAVAYLYLNFIIFSSKTTPLDSWVFRDLTLVLGTASLSISWVHYYYDSQIFRFSKPEFRDNVLPLMTPVAQLTRAVGDRSSDSKP